MSKRKKCEHRRAPETRTNNPNRCRTISKNYSIKSTGQFGRGCVGLGQGGVVAHRGEQSGEQIDSRSLLARWGRRICLCNVSVIVVFVFYLCLCCFCHVGADQANNTYRTCSTHAALGPMRLYDHTHSHCIRASLVETVGPQCFVELWASFPHQ